jgi:hypothetical protein
VNRSLSSGCAARPKIHSFHFSKKESLSMDDNTSLLRAAAHPMNTDGVKPLAPTLMCRAEKCEYTETVKALCCNGWLPLQAGTEGNHRAQR